MKHGDRPLALALAALISTPLLASGQAPCEHGLGTPGSTGSIGVNGAFTRATTDQDKAGADLSLVVRRSPSACGESRARFRLLMSLSYDSKQKADQAPVITRVHRGEAQYLRMIASPFYVSGNAWLLHNNSLGVHLQGIYSVIAGLMFDQGLLSGEVFGGPGLVRNEPIDGTARGSVAGSVGETVSLSLSFLTPGAEVAQALRLTLPTKAEVPRTIAATASLILPLTSRVRVVCHTFYDQNSDPPPKFERSFVTTSLGVTITLGAIQ